MSDSLLEGLIDSQLHFHYDIGNDVLYIRRVDRKGRESFGEDTADAILFRDAETDEPVGWTAVNWWKLSFGVPLPDSLAELTNHIGTWAHKHPI
jgi:hypothetical protein